MPASTPTTVSLRAECTGAQESGALRLLSLLTLVMLVFFIPHDTVAADADLRQRALELVNESRAEQGLAPLETDRALQAAAQRHAEDMLGKGYFSHTSPEGTSVLDRFRAAGGSDSLMVAENIGRCGHCGRPVTEMQIEDMHGGWMESPGHRQNILREGLSRFGFGFAVDKVGGLYAVQTFAGPGTPGAGSGDQVQKVVSDREAAQLALDRLNRTRREQGLDPATLSDPLTRAVRQALSDAKASGGLTLRNVGGSAVLDLVPTRELGDIRSLSTVAGECGGCGEVVTNGDVESFLGQWLGNPQYREHLLQPGPLSLGFAAAADGTGRKVAIALVGSR